MSYHYKFVAIELKFGVQGEFAAGYFDPAAMVDP
jgi:hypothetical protein